MKVHILICDWMSDQDKENFEPRIVYEYDEETNNLEETLQHYEKKLKDWE